MALLGAAVVTINLFAGCGSTGAEQTGNNADGTATEAVQGKDSAGGGNAAQSVAGSADTVIVAMSPSSEPAAGFNPCINWGCGEHCHEPLIQSTLIRTNVDMEFENDLATDYSVSEDGLTWTFHIRDDVKFTDGEPLTASDVAFTFNTALATPNSEADLSMLDSVEAPDDTTVIFHMSKPYNAFLYTLAVFGIVPEHCYDEAAYGENPVGSGRYILTQWDKGQQVIFEANPDYYGDAPKMKTVTVLFMDEDAAYAAALSGQVDLAYTSAAYSDQTVDGFSLFDCKTVDNRGFNLPVIPAGETDENGVALGNDFTSDVSVRRAINLAINREEMIDHVLNGYGTVAYSVCDQMPWYNPAAETDYDPDMAKAILKEDGWEAGEGGILTKDGVRAEFTLMYPTGDSVRQALAEDTANQLKAFGINVTTEGVGWDTAYDRAQSTPLMWGWGAHTPMELYNIYHTAPGKKYAEYSPYANVKVDEYMDAALAESDLEKSYELWKDAQWDGTTGITQDGDLPWIWLVNIDHLYWVKDGLQVAEQKLHPHGHGWSIVNNVDQWTWK